MSAALGIDQPDVVKVHRRVDTVGPERALDARQAIAVHRGGFAQLARPEQRGAIRVDLGQGVRMIRPILMLEHRERTAV